MAAVQCDNFVGNAWKKDLCLNCFKSKEEHLLKNGLSHPVIIRIPDPPKEGILKVKKSNTTPKGNKVIFLNQECEVIGFGGDDVYSDDEFAPDKSSQSHTEDDEDSLSEEDRAFQKLTKSNTDFNSIPENLQEPKEGEIKKIIEPLKLGKHVFDDRGNKKTLLVSVTPFGDQTAVKNKLNTNGFKTNEPEFKTNGHIEGIKSEIIQKDSATKSQPICNNKTLSGLNNGAKENLPEPKSEAKDKTQANEEDASLKLANDKSIKRSQPLDKNFRFRLNKNSEVNGKEETDTRKRTTEKVNDLIEKVKDKVGQFPIKSDNQNKKFRTNFIKKTAENNKPIVDIYEICENEEVNSNNDVNETKTVKSVLMSSDTANKFQSSVEKITSKVDIPNKEIPNGFGVDENKLTPTVKEDKSEIFQSESTLDRNKLIPNVSSLHRHRFKSPKKEDKVEEAEKHVFEPFKNGLVSSMSLIPNLECKYTKTTFDNSNSKDSSNIAANESSKDEFKKTSFESFESFEKLIKGEEITLFSAEKRREDEKMSKNDNAVPEISRESAGEPDGRADSDEFSEPPSLPLKPPPLLTECRNAFLNDLAAGNDAVKFTEKPKVPTKPVIIQSKKTNFQSPVHTNRGKAPSIEKSSVLTSSSVKPHPPLQESSSTDSSKLQKRQAPKPPSPKEDSSDRYVAVPAEVESDDSEKKKASEETVTKDSIKGKSRSTENLLELISVQQKTEQLNLEGVEEISVPEPVPRRSLSLSQDSLVACEVVDVQSKKKPNRGKFLLRKLLHIGKPKELTKDLIVRQKASLPPASKPKLEIIHPSALNGSRVEVVPPARTSKSRRTSSSASSSSGEQRESDVLSDSSTSHSMSSSGNDSQTIMDRAKKPPPPPRCNTADTWSAKPARPPPPKAIDILRQANSSWNASADIKPDNLYVNLGEARTGLAPNKPVRTGSLRETSVEIPKRIVTVVTQPEDSDYESFVAAPVQYSTPSHQSDENLYECVQVSAHRASLPECDSTITDSSGFAKDKRFATSRNFNYRRSDGDIDVSPDYFKMKFLRSSSQPSPASEMDSDVYSPYSFYGSELGDEEYEPSSVSSQALRISRLKLKKGRSIVHKNLEDNYGAVIVANHEALAQVVEQMRQGPIPPAPLRALSTAVNLRWTDFTISKDTVGVVVEKRVFYPALWGVHPVTLSLMAEQGLNSSFHAKGPFNLNPLAELNDLIPVSYLPMLKKDESEFIQASISVLTRLQVETVETYGRNMSAGVLSDDSKKEINFVLLQIINAFKTLQAQGIEEAPKNLTNLIVCREEKDPHPRVCITHSFDRSEEAGSRTSLCLCINHAIKDILPPTEFTPLISNLLLKEKAVSLSQAKSILEFTLWGPADIAFGNSNRERESALQRWLDLERATVLHGLVRTRAELTVFEEWQLLFLVRTNAKMMTEASWLLESGTDEEYSTA